MGTCTDVIGNMYGRLELSQGNLGDKAGWIVRKSRLHTVEEQAAYRGEAGCIPWCSRLSAVMYEVVDLIQKRCT